MKQILIRTSEIINCWETKDACIIETTKGKKWVCKKVFTSSEDLADWSTISFIKEHQHQDFITLELIEKGKCEKNG